MPDCIFCKIIVGEIPAKKLAESPSAIAIADISPQAPFHALVIPKRHVTGLDALDGESRRELLPALFDLADQLAVEHRLKGDGGGYRAVINNGPLGGQTVFHLHVHMMGGQQMKPRFGG